MGQNRDLSKFPNAITVLDNGNVGIANINPQHKLDITSGEINISDTYGIRSSGELMIRRSGNEFRIGSGVSADYFVLYAGGAEKFRVNSDGQVCVNNTGGTSGGVNHPFIVKAKLAQGIWIESNANDSAIYMDNDGATPIIGVSYRTATGYLPLTFKTSGQERLRITPGGSINLGSTTDYTQIGIDGTGTYIEKMASPTEGKRKIRLQAGNSASTQYTQFIIDGSNQNMEFRTNSTARMTISNNGQINTPYQPAFFAIGLPSDLYATYGGGPITFASAPTNRGNHWSGSRFTAPIFGIYYMAFESMYKHVDGDITFRVTKNGTPVSYSNPHTRDNAGNYPPWAQSTTTWVGTLAAGDYIEFTFASSNNGSTYIYAGGLYTKVYGYMIG